VNKYPSRLPQDERNKILRLAKRVKSLSLRCHVCQQETPHYFTRIGVNGSLYACVNCGSERTG
jgi:hypothetical protein